MPPFFRAALLAASSAVLPAFGAAPLSAGEKPWRRVTAVLHLHSDISPRGVVPFPAMASLAEKKKLDVLIPTDHFMSRWEYGLPPMAGILRVSRRESDASKFGLEKYVSLGRGRPNLLVMPSVETCPAYRWTGHPAQGTLTLHDAQRHMLIIGLTDPAVLRRLPVQSNPKAGRIPWARLAMPLITVAVGVSLMIRWPAGLLVVALGLLWGLNQRPFRRIAAAESYARNGYDAAQGLIDYVNAHGGLAVWAHPEAVNWKDPVKLYRGASMATLPYPEAVSETDGAAGFGYFWEGYRTVGAVGGLWDQALSAWLAGKRRAPLWAFGETDWSQENRLGVSIDRIQDVLWVRERTAPEVMEAFRKGRFYVVEKPVEPVMVLEEWKVGGAISGETAAWSSGAGLSVRLSGAGRVKVEVIRNGAVWKAAEGDLPFSVAAPVPSPAGAGDFYRFTARSAGQLISNPIFVKRR